MAKMTIAAAKDIYNKFDVMTETFGETNAELWNKISGPVYFNLRELHSAIEHMSEGAPFTRIVNRTHTELRRAFGLETAPSKPKVGHEIALLCEHLGENAPTKRLPQRKWIDGQDENLLEEMVTRCVSWDNDMLVEVRRFEKKIVTVPTWCTEEFYCANPVAIKYYLGFGAKMEWPKSWYEKLKELGTKERFAVIKLLNQKTFKVEKRRELRDRFVDWLNGEGELLRYDFVNIRNKFIDHECDCESNRLYWDR